MNIDPKLTDEEGLLSRSLSKPVHWTKNFLATHSFLGFFNNNERVPHWRKTWSHRSDYMPHQGRKERARRIK
jgi:hypothetical protein